MSEQPAEQPDDADQPADPTDEPEVERKPSDIPAPEPIDGPDRSGDADPGAGAD